MVYFNILGRSIIVIDSYDVACELLDKRSRNYSDRPDSVMLSLYVISWSKIGCITHPSLGTSTEHHYRLSTCR